MPANNPPSLDVFEGLAKWGEVRLRPDHRDNVIYVELQRHETNGEQRSWKPLFAFCCVGGKIAFRLMAEMNERVLVYEPTTGTFANVTGKG